MCTGPLTSYTELLSSLLQGTFWGLEELPPLDLPSLEDPRVGFGVEGGVGLLGDGVWFCPAHCVAALLVHSEAEQTEMSQTGAEKA